MYREELTRVRRALISGGVEPFFVARTLAELSDHYEDLEAEARAAGYSESEASLDAMERLGRGQVIAEEVLRHPELKSWAFRWAWVPAVLRHLVILMSLATVPAVVVVTRGSVIVRWCVSTGLAVLLTGGLLLLMTQAISGGFPV